MTAITDKTIAIIAVGVMAIVLSLAVAFCIVLERGVPAEVVTLLATLAGVLVGGHAFQNGVRLMNGNGKE